ncbi:hypothetical protein B0H21DRAFT_741828 [Amylocystis lapponica]|nr:hypothetical protein B0H21DRAFT_741828 [Amylocystis lapponica]
MGFCRRCGDIVVGPRCKCGGTSVAPVVKWTQGENQPLQDRWSRTYVTREKSPTRQPVHTLDETPPVSSTSTPAKRFPRPASATQSTPVVLGSRVSSHIASATYSSLLGEDSSLSANAAAGILPNPNGSELAKVYGSVLQAKETLSSYQCAICSTPFSPDATIYPDPASLSSGADESVWHKKCFDCSGCFKYIGDNPMVDLLGRPSCADCFESCLSRPAADSPQRRGNSIEEDKRSNLGGTRRTDKSREGSPALDELEQRLGIVRSRENTPSAEERIGRMNCNVTGDTSPIVERLAARVRLDSSTGFDTPPLLSMLELGTPSGRAMNRFKTPEPETASDDGSPLPGRRSYRLTSPEPELSRSDGSPAPRRSYTRFRTPEPDGSGSPVSYSRTSNSPRYGSPVSAKQPTEEAIEEMKKRFLGQSSPAPGGADTSISSVTSTPTGRSIYSSRSSYSAVDSADDPFPTSMSRIPRTSTTPALRTRASASSIRSSLPRDLTGSTIPRDTTGTTVLRDLTGTDYTLHRDRTGDAEVESLLGAAHGVVHGDLIDLGSPHSSVSSALPRSESTGPMHKIPLSSRGAVSSGLTRMELDLRASMSSSSLKQDYQQLSMPSTPDLAGDFSDTTSTTQSSAPSTRPHTGHSGAERRSSNVPTSTPKSKVSIPEPSPMASDARCAKCNLPLFSTKHGGKFVTVPEEPSSTGVPPKTYHTACFTCRVCGGLFEERDGGRAVFVRGQDGACHVECAPAEKIKTRQMTSQLPRPSVTSVVHTVSSSPTHKPKAKSTSTYSAASSSRYERPPTTAPPTNATFTFPRFGGSASCPGCGKAVAVMEKGVVPGPGGTRWHAACLICGGKEAKGRRKEEGKPGCGKKLDSAAKSDRDGGVWCRECLLLLPMPMRQTPSPTRPLATSTTGGRTPFSGVAPQYTGTTTIARQFTGRSDAGIMRQLTGGGLSPTRQLTSSPTKMHDGPRPGAGRYPRPRSVIGVRSTKSDGEGRGMFLVRQLTGGNGGSSGNEYGL